jgi:hypothetical protein
MIRSGAALFGALGDSRGIEAGLRDAGLDLAALRGAPLRDALDAIAKAFAPKNGDGAKVELAIVTAMSEALGDVEDFDPTALTDDVMNAALVAFLRECIFQQMMSETATAFNRTADKNQAAAAEWELHELVKVVVDVAMAAVLVGPVRALTRTQIEQVQASAIRDVWTRWEANIQ